MTRNRHVVFLDRDGTLVHSDVVEGVPVPTHDTVELIDGASQACDELRRLGYALVMVTNQPDVARGTVDRETVEDANRRIAAALGLDMALTCMHDDLDRCNCRKPRPGMLLQAAAALDIRLDHLSVMIGDRWRDIDAGAAAGVTTVLLDRGYGELLNTTPDHVAVNLPSAVDWIGAHLRKSST